MINPELEDKVVVVTGANNPHGIGAAIAKAFAKQRAKVFLHYFRNSSMPMTSKEVTTPGEAFYRAQQAKHPIEVVDAINDLNGHVEAWEADLADATLIPTLFDRAERAFGPVDVLVNNAATWEGDTFLPMGTELPNRLYELFTERRPQSVSAASFDRLFAINTRAPVLLMAEFARRHIARQATRGRMINVSTAGAYCFPSEISYGATKFALESYTRSAAVELGSVGITVNTVSLGPVQTGWITSELEQQILPTIPLGRIGRPEDVTDVVVFLASEQARWVTGQKIYVGGGHGM